LDLVAQHDGPAGGPGSLAGAVGIGGKHVVLRRERLHQRAPLARAARVGVQADDAGTRAGLAKERLHRYFAPAFFSIAAIALSFSWICFCRSATDFSSSFCRV